MNILPVSHASLSGLYVSKTRSMPRALSVALPIIAAVDVAICVALTVTIVPLFFLGTKHLYNTIAAIILLVQSPFIFIANLFGAGIVPELDYSRNFVGFKRKICVYGDQSTSYQSNPATVEQHRETLAKRQQSGEIMFTGPQQKPGGTCMAMALDYTDRFISTSQKFPARRAIEIVSQDSRYQSSSEEFVNQQIAFNTLIRNEGLPAPKDFRREKVQALANFHLLQIKEASEVLDLSPFEEVMKKIHQNQDPVRFRELRERCYRQLYDVFLEKIYKNLKNGVYLVRSLHLADTNKGEVTGHSTVFIKSDEGEFFYDPNEGTREIDRGKSHLFDNLLHSFIDCFNDAKLSDVRFYRMERDIPSAVLA